MSKHQFLYLSRHDVAAAGVGMPEIIDALETAFAEHGRGNVEMPPKPGVHSRPDAFIHAMPAYIPSLDSIGVKWVSGYPQNQDRGLPYITGLLVLNDADTGLPLAVMDCTWITAKRTGAASALAAKYLARPESETLGVLGCGVQGRSNLEALRVLFPLKRVVAYDHRLANALRYRRRTGGQVRPGCDRGAQPARGRQRLRSGGHRGTDPAHAARDDPARLAGRRRLCVAGRFQLLLASRGAGRGR